MKPGNAAPKCLLSIVVPVYNERQNLEALIGRLLEALRELRGSFELLFVDDGSTDGSDQLLGCVASHDQAVRMLRLTRNFGHQAALFAGLEHARGKAVVTMDGDLQHPPELIPALIERWRAGFDIVQAVRREPVDASPLKRSGSRGFYRLLAGVSRLRVTPGAADFRLMSREAVDAFLSCRERCRFNRGLVQWIGFSYTELPYDAQPRRAGRSKYSYSAMLRLAGDAVFSFSSLPLRLAGLAGGCVSLAAAGYLVFVLWAAVFTQRTVPGWSSILATVLILGGVQLLVLWILGEYVGRLYEEAKQRPMYIVRSTPPAPTAPPIPATRSAADTLHAPGPADPTESSVHARQD